MDLQAPPRRPAPERHDIRFTGDGGEFFGVWMVNVVLTVLTLGLYTPWARRRTARYFFGHTLVADSPLEFTAPIGRMVFGFLVLVALYGAFQLASGTGQGTAIVLMMSGAVLAMPWLWGSAMRFRLANTRWRGLRPRFVASWGEIYRAAWPLLAAIGVAAVAGFLIGSLDLVGDATLADGALPKRMQRPSIGLVVLLIVAALAVALCAVRMDFNGRMLVASRTRIGEQTCRWDASFGQCVRIFGGAVGIFVLTLLAISLVSVTVFMLGGVLWRGGRPGPLAAVGLGFLAGAGFVLALMLVWVPAIAYRQARMFHLRWNHMGIGSIARFRCHLRTGAFVWLRLRNAVLSVLTFGIYRPFARIQEYRMQIDSVELFVRGGLDTLVGSLEQQQQQGSFGDAAAEAVGLDLIA